MRMLPSPLRAAAFAFFISVVAGGVGANPTMIRDINSTVARPAAGMMLTPALTSLQMGIAVMGGVGYFAGTDAQHGFELWRTDGTAAGTYMVKDIDPTGWSVASNFVVGGSTLYFMASDGNGTSQIWKSDGTAAGTVAVTAFGGLASPALNPSTLRYANGLLFFLGIERPSSGTHLQLIRSDGTAAGTFMLARLENGFFAEPTAAGSRLFFVHQSPAEGFELWATDGTVAGTGLVKDINPGPNGSSPGRMVDVGGVLYFAAFEPSGGTELWRSDGTTAGTYRVKDIVPGPISSGPSQLTRVGSELFFVASGPGGRELWKSDGTDAGTVQVADLTPGPDSSAIAGTWDVNGLLYFTLTDAATGNELWRSDGTAAGTYRLLDINPGPASSFASELVAVGAQFFFQATDAAGTELWRSDGTPAGTVRVADIQPGAGSSSPGQLAALGGVLVFSAEDVAGNRELWRSDGTAGGTHLVADINPAAMSSWNGAFGSVGAEILFAADDGIAGAELWKTDGTFAGTVRVKDINPGAAGSGVSGFSSAALGTSYLFAANDGVSGSELWKSDGTTAGTVMVADINPGSPGSFPARHTNLDGIVYFTASDATAGNELWRSDGTTAGTFRVRDIAPGAASSNIVSTFPRFPIANHRIYFNANDGTGAELWSSDGTAAGTVKVTSFNPGFPFSSAAAMGAAGPWMMFVRPTPGLPPPGSLGTIELWRTDGTPAGTSMVRTFTNTGPILEWVEYGGLLYFIANDGVSGSELWRTDGTVAGTALVRDTLPGINGGTAGNGVRVAAGLLWFSATDGVNGRELWRSDGTAAGTFMVADVNPGAAPSGPNLLGEFAGEVYFAAYRSGVGLQIWRTTGLGAPVVQVGNVLPTVPSISGAGALPNGLLLSMSDGVISGIEPWILAIGDSMPDAFAFATANGVLPGSLVVSAAATPTGFTGTANVSVIGGDYSIGCTATFTSTPGMLSPGQSICVRHVASLDLSATTTTVLNVGGRMVGFSSVTVGPAPAGAARDDVNGDGRADLVWVDAAGNVTVDLMDGAEAGYSIAYAVAPGTSVRDIADFNRDGRSDLLLVDQATGLVSIALFQGTTFSPPIAVGSAPAGYSLVGAARIAGNGSADIVWRNNAGRLLLWTMNGTTIEATSTPAAVGGGWDVIGLGDVDGDGRADAVVANSGRQLRAVALAGPTAGSERRISARAPQPRSAGMGDIDGDGRADILWHDGDALVGWRMNGAEVLAERRIATLPAGASVLKVADLSGDGRADVVVRLAGGAVQLWTLEGFNVTSVSALAVPPGAGLAGR